MCPRYINNLSTSSSSSVIISFCFIENPPTTILSSCLLPFLYSHVQQQLFRLSCTIGVCTVLYVCTVHTLQICSWHVFLIPIYNPQNSIKRSKPHSCQKKKNRRIRHIAQYLPSSLAVHLTCDGLLLPITYVKLFE